MVIKSKSVPTNTSHKISETPHGVGDSEKKNKDTFNNLDSVNQAISRDLCQKHEKAISEALDSNNYSLTDLKEILQLKVSL